MSTKLLERNAERIRKKTELIYADSESISEDAQEGDGNRWESIALTCIGLGKLWLSLVSDVCADDDYNMRDNAEPLRAAARVSLAACKAVLAKVAEAGLQQHITDLELMRHEMENLIEWLETWPDWDSTQRDISRAAIEEGRVLSPDEFVAMLT